MMIIKLDVGTKVQMRDHFFSSCGVGKIIEATDCTTTSHRWDDGEVTHYHSYRVEWDGGGVSPWLTGMDLCTVSGVL